MSSQGQPTAREALARGWVARTKMLTPGLTENDELHVADNILGSLAEHGFSVVSTRPADLETAMQEMDGILPALGSDLYRTVDVLRAVLVALGATVPEQ